MPGPRVFRFRIAPRAGELVTQNNQREALVDVYDRTEKILYFEGEPRPEMKFMRRAVDDDKNLQVVTLLRTADNKFYRLVLDTPDELAGGFPKTREELFAYRGLILGSIEAGAFTGDQLRMIAEFVERRGGGLLMLGGARSFAEGGYAGTPVADALPVIARARGAAPDDVAVSRLKVQPTRAGEGHALTQIAPTEAASLEPLERSAAAHQRQRDQGASSRARRCCSPAPTSAARIAAGARLPALRPRQGARVPGAGLVALADARQHVRSRT